MFEHSGKLFTPDVTIENVNFSIIILRDTERLPDCSIPCVQMVLNMV